MKKQMENQKSKIYSSFRDPSGYVYTEKDSIFRKVFPCYYSQYNHLMSSGLFDELISNNMIVNHTEVKNDDKEILLLVEKIPFISYPYEWSFDEYKDAALLTLNILKTSLKYNMILKDASAYNIQIKDGEPIFIDTLSFDFYEDNKAWGAYGQFCRHFMAPLLLMSYVDIRSNLLMSNFIDGIPLDFANNMLKNRGGLVSKMHIKWHSKSVSKHNNDASNKKAQNKITKKSLENMIDMMIRQIEKLSLKKEFTEWDNYYDNTNYDDVSQQDKVNLTEKYINEIKLKKEDVVFDVGSNDGKYSKILTKNGNLVVSFDIDHNCVNRNYLINKDNKVSNILPLIIDFTNPSASIGFANLERDSFTKRGNAKCVMALAVIHHICISNNITFDMLASWLSKLGEYLIIEFVPKSDSKVQKLLSTRKDIFDKYNIEEFEKTFSNYYKIIEKNKIKNSERVLFLLKRREDI